MTQNPNQTPSQNQDTPPSAKGEPNPDPKPDKPFWRPRHPPMLVFAPLAWLKLQLFLHGADNEVGGFGISADDDPLYIEDFVTVKQTVSSVTVELDDQAVADHFDRCVDRGLVPQQFARCWCHTHPGDSPTPSGTDEQTFARVFGSCDWSVMFVIARSGRTYARLSFSAGPGGDMLIPVAVDWASWPPAVMEHRGHLDDLVAGWIEEYRANIQPVRLYERPAKGRPQRVPSDDPALESLAEEMALAGVAVDEEELAWWDSMEAEVKP